jgi:hypothetical protein
MNKRYSMEVCHAEHVKHMARNLVWFKCIITLYGDGKQNTYTFREKEPAVSLRRGLYHQNQHEH